MILQQPYFKLMHLQRVKFKDLEQIPHIQLNKDFKKDFQGSAPAPFIGSLLPLANKCRE